MQHPSHTDISSLAPVFQDSVALKRLPLAEQSFLSGDAMQFIGWKAALTSLIDQRASISLGQPFTIHRAFREKLNNWPWIQTKDAQRLRIFSDFQERIPNHH